VATNSKKVEAPHLLYYNSLFDTIIMELTKGTKNV